MQDNYGTYSKHLTNVFQIIIQYVLILEVSLSKTDIMDVFVRSIHTTERLYGMILAFCSKKSKFISLQYFNVVEL